MVLPVTYYNCVNQCFHMYLPFTNQHIITTHYLDHPMSSQCHRACISPHCPMKSYSSLQRLWHHIPKNNGSYTHHTIIIKCQLKLARQKALEEKFSCLKEKGLSDVTQSAADMFNDDLTNLNGDYTDIEDTQPQNQTHKNEIGKARLRGFTTHGRIFFHHRGINGNNNAGT